MIFACVTQSQNPASHLEHIRGRRQAFTSYFLSVGGGDGLVFLNNFFLMDVFHSVYRNRYEIIYSHSCSILRHITPPLTSFIAFFVFLSLPVQALLSGQGNLPSSEKHCRKTFSFADQGDAAVFHVHVTIHCLVDSV